MKKGIDEIVEIWKKGYSEGIKEKKTYPSTDQLRRISSLFSPGHSFYYILNFHNLEFEFISDEVEEITGFKKDNVALQDLLSIAQDLPVLQKKENVVQDFALNHTESQDLLDYKFIYTYSIKDLNGNPRTILLQNIVLSTSEEGNVQHVLGIHTDVTHLKLAASDTLSIIHMKGGTSYYNVSVEDGSFSIENASRKARAFPELTSREKEVTRCFARGLSADQVSKELDISYHTVRTHRNNLLKKCNCSNTTELVAQCLAAGVIGV